MKFATLMARNRDGVRKLETIGEYLNQPLTNGLVAVVGFMTLCCDCWLGLHYAEHDSEAPSTLLWRYCATVHRLFEWNTMGDHGW